MRLDEIVREEVLLTPDQLAKLTSTDVSRDDNGWLIVEDADAIAFNWQPPTRRDFEPFDLISVSLCVDAPAWTLSSHLLLETFEPDSTRQNGYHLGTPGIRRNQGTFRFDLPYENFHMDGFPDGWRDINQFILSIMLPEGGRVAVGPVYLVQRKRVSGPRRTDEELFSQDLNLDYPGLEAVRDAVKRGNLDESGQQLMAYFEKRKNVQHHYGAPSQDKNRDNMVAAADNFMKGVFSGQQFGAPINWRVNPNGYLEWRHALNRHGCLGTLFNAWQVTGNSSYLAKLDEALTRWLAVSPEPTGMNDGGGDPAWETLSIACRLVGTWPDIFFGVGKAPEFAQRTKIDMLKSFIAHAEHLLKWQGYANNWIIVESYTLALVGILFPEFKRSSQWRDQGIARLLKEMERQVWPDGVETEVAPGYHWMTGQAFGDFLILARENHIDVPQEFAETIEQMSEYHLFLARPDRTLPSMNDSGGVIGMAGNALAFGSKQFGREDMLWLLTNRNEGVEPDHTSHAFPDAGVYVMRSDWSSYANWMAFRGGNIGASHMHEGRLGFDLAAYGSPVLVDPGAANYKPDELRNWSCSTAAHNTAMIDGLGQCQRKLSYNERTASVRDVNFWQTTSVCDITAARHIGPYCGEQEITDVAHHREIHFIKPYFWVMLDVFTSNHIHTVNLLFHFMPMVVRLNSDPIAIRTNRLAHPNLEILPVNWPSAAKISMICGSLGPVQGWVALEGEWAPAPCVQADIPFEKGLALITLLIPLSRGLTSGFQVCPGQGNRWRVDTPYGVHTIVLERETFDPGEPRITPMAQVTS